MTLTLSLAAAHFAYGTDAAALWSSKVQPLFDVNCVKCHGPLEQKSGLELDTPQAVLKRYGREFVHWCFENNTTVRPRP